MYKKNKQKKIVQRQNFLRNFDAGFTVIETLVAISILLLSVVGPMEIASKSLLSAIYAKDQITAYYLAQEGIEVLRNTRDENSINGDPLDPSFGWADGLEACIGPNGCNVDPTDSSIQSCGVTPCGKLMYNSDLYLLDTNIDAGTNPSKFTRTIKVSNADTAESLISDATDLNDNSEILIISEVSWQSGLLGRQRTFTLRETLHNWPNQ